MSRIRYSEELKQHLLNEVAAGVSVAKLARDYDPCAATIHHWVRERRPPEDDGETRSGPERELEKQVSYLERQVALLKRELPGLRGNATPTLVRYGVSIDRR